jgi:hypothetical protein
MSEFGIKIGKSGKNVQDCTETELLFYSNADAWKAIKEGSVAGNSTIAHGLGYVPAFDIYLVSGGNIYSNEAAWADSTNLYLGKTAGETIKYKIYSAKII